jgi:copper chaperone NosL
VAAMIALIAATSRSHGKNTQYIGKFRVTKPLGVVMNALVMNVFRMTVVAVLFSYALASASEVEPTKPSKEDKCPVCGMFVAKYPDFLAQIVFKDGSRAFFDGVKDMFKYYFNMKKYNPSKNLSDISFVYVTDYYSRTPIDGRKAWYVAGGNVLGPMGNELMPFEKEDDAKEFMADHAGKTLVRFDAITPDLIAGLE